jgi:glycine hydroxymethyltransferase
MIADDPRPALDPSGIRFGTPAMTTRGMKEAEATTLAELMIETMRHQHDTKKKETIRAEVKTLCERFPVPDAFV